MFVFVPQTALIPVSCSMVQPYLRQVEKQKLEILRSVRVIRVFIQAPTEQGNILQSRTTPQNSCQWHDVAVQPQLQQACSKAQKALQTWNKTIAEPCWANPIFSRRNLSGLGSCNRHVASEMEHMIIRAVMFGRAANVWWNAS